MNTILKLKDDKKLQYMVAGSAAAAMIVFYAIYRYKNRTKTPAID